MLHALVLSFLLAAASHTTAPHSAQVVAVHDGDTITVKLDGRTEKVRLVGIDAPELDDERQDYRDAGYTARNYARSRLGGESVTLETEPRQGDRDRFGRLLRYVVLRDGTNFNEEMVRKGYVHVYDRFEFTLKPRFKSAETEAKHEKRGVWTLRPGPWREVPRKP